MEEEGIDQDLLITLSEVHLHKQLQVKLQKVEGGLQLEVI